MSWLDFVFHSDYTENFLLRGCTHRTPLGIARVENIVYVENYTGKEGGSVISCDLGKINADTNIDPDQKEIIKGIHQEYIAATKEIIREFPYIVLGTEAFEYIHGSRYEHTRRLTYRLPVLSDGDFATIKMKKKNGEWHFAPQHMDAPFATICSIEDPTVTKSCDRHIHHIHDALLFFRSEEDYVLFILANKSVE